MDSENRNEQPKRKGASVGVRHLQVLMLFLAAALGLSTRVIMSIAIVDMTDSAKEQFFPWSIQTQSVILSSFFWGYIVLQVPAGELANRYGGKVLLLISIAGNSLVLLLIPLAANYGDWQAVCACRIIQGLFQGFLLPTFHGLIAKWVPLNEKSRLGMFVYSGCPFGLGFQLLISGFIANSWGWPVVFYVSAVLGFVWTLLYYIFGADCPESSKFIKDDEKQYIQESLGQVKASDSKKLQTPWKVLWTSLAFLSLIVAHIGHSWGMYTLMNVIPTYISKVLSVNIKDNGILSALPYLAMTLMGIPFGCLSEILLQRKLMTVTGTRKLSNTIAFFGAGISLLALSYAPADITIVTALLCVTVGLTAGYVTGFFLVHIDMAPNFASTMMGITNGVSNLIAILAPLIAGVILKNDTNQSEWRKLFYLTAGCYVLTNLVFIIFGTSDRQAWNQPDFKPSTNNSSKKKMDIATCCDRVA